MKLKEKFTTMVLDKDIADWEKVCVEIADEFAIGFAEWYLDLWNRNDKSFDNNSPKQLLQIYKKEKGL